MFNRLLPYHRSNILVESLSSKRRNQIHSKDVKTPGRPLRVLFLGRDEFSCVVFKELYAARDVWNEIHIATYPDEKLRRRGSAQSVSPLKLLGHSFSVPVHEIPDNKKDFRVWKPPEPFTPHTLIQTSVHLPLDYVLITASFGRILSSSLLQLFSQTRRLNVHPSLLPAYRGAAPIQRAIMNGEKETGVCVIEMLERHKGIDAGSIWASLRLPVPENSRFAPLRDTLAQKGGELLVRSLRDMMAGKETSIPQPRSTSAPKAPLIKAGDSVLDFGAMRAEDIVRRDYAISHQRPLTTHFSSQKALQFHSPSVFAASPSELVVLTRPGLAMYHSKTSSLLIRCASNTVLEVPKVRQEGKALMAAKDWWNGAKGLGLVQDRCIQLGIPCSVSDKPHL